MASGRDIVMVVVVGPCATTIITWAEQLSLLCCRLFGCMALEAECLCCLHRHTITPTRRGHACRNIHAGVTIVPAAGARLLGLRHCRVARAGVSCARAGTDRGGHYAAPRETGRIGRRGWWAGARVAPPFHAACYLPSPSFLAFSRLRTYCVFER